MNIEMVAGNTKEIEITVVDSDGQAVDLSGYVARWGLFKPHGGGALVLKASATGGIDVSQAASGLLVVSLAAADTDGLAGLYLHECEVEGPGGEIETVVQGEVRVAEKRL